MVMLHIFSKYLKLKNNIPYISLGNFPTKLQSLDFLNKQYCRSDIYIKRDDLSNDFYGGNKVRKLEFLLADAKNKNKKTIITFGLAGSNHALATTIFSKQTGLSSVSMLLPQANSHFLKNNLIFGYLYEADIRLRSNKFFLALDTAYVILKKIFTEKMVPYIIPPGGSSVLGNIGFVNAAFEISEQLRVTTKNSNKQIKIFLPLGSCGSAVGLILGFKLLNINVKVIGVRVTDVKYANFEKIIHLVKKTNIFLNKIDKSVPLVRVSQDDFEIIENFFGKGYGYFSREDIDAINLLNLEQGIKLDGTYSGKTFAAFLDYIKKNPDLKEVLIFWDTFSSLNLESFVKNFDYKLLPYNLHRYFQEPVQSLDYEIK